MGAPGRCRPLPPLMSTNVIIRQHRGTSADAARPLQRRPPRRSDDKANPENRLGFPWLCLAFLAFSAHPTLAFVVLDLGFCGADLGFSWLFSPPAAPGKRRFRAHPPAAIQQISTGRRRAPAPEARGTHASARTAGGGPRMRSRSTMSKSGARPEKTRAAARGPHSGHART